MKLENKLSIGLIFFIILSLVILNSFLQPQQEYKQKTHDNIGAVSQGLYVDLHIGEDNITISDKFPQIGDSISIDAEVSNLGTTEAIYRAELYLDHSGTRIELANKSETLEQKKSEILNFDWHVAQDIKPGIYQIVPVIARKVSPIGSLLGIHSALERRHSPRVGKATSQGKHLSHRGGSM